MSEGSGYQLKRSISKGLDFLYYSQLPYGEFKTNLSPDKSMTGEYRYVSTTYITTFVLYSLGFIKDPRAEEMTVKGLKFLQQEMELPGIWRFFGTNRSLKITPEGLKLHTPMGIIPDLDDTACAAYCLKANGIPIPDNSEVIQNNRNEQGLYHTWLQGIPKRAEYDEETVYLAPKGNDVCCGVLSNILLYLGENEETKRSSTYINHLIEEGSEESHIPYFPNRLVLYYLLSRAYYQGVHSLGESKERVLNRILEMKKEDGSFGSPQATALAVSTYLNFNCRDECLDDAVQFICRTQKENGGWNGERFCDEYIRCYFSTELTTALCLEAIYRYKGVKNNEKIL